MSDDQGWGDTGYNGHPVILTPELDAMAAEGYVFNQFYAAAPNCSPSRASILTGRNHVRCKVSNHGHYMRAQEITLAEALKDAGYVTGAFGKMHIGSGQTNSPANPSAMGFDEWVVGLNYFDVNPYLSHFGDVDYHPAEQGSVITMDETIDFLDRHKGGGKPMFVLAWFPAPHQPFHEGDSNLYVGETHAGYYREVTLLDEQLGRLRQWLRDNSIHENTILWFCSDNGGRTTGESATGGRGGKGGLYEGGLRVPAIIEWPARSLAGSTDVPVVHTDMYPTLLAIVGVSVENQLPLDGEDVRSIMEGTSTTHGSVGFWDELEAGQATQSDPILSAIMAKQLAGDPLPHDPARIKKDIDEFPQLAVATPSGNDPWVAWLEWPWKLHRRYNTSSYELYNLESDPMEATNLVAVPEHLMRVANMKTNMWAWQESVIGSINGSDYGQREAWLPMNRTAGVEAFDANGGKRADLVNFADNTSHWVAGRHNRAVELDGVDDELDMDNDYFYPPVGANERTVSAWIKTGSSGRICQWGDAAFTGSAWDVAIDGAGKLRLDTGTGFLAGQTDLRDNLWHHIAVVFPNTGTPNVTDAILYVDGSAETPSASIAEAVRTSNSEIQLGGARTSFISIDEFKIVPEAWSAADVLAEFNATNQASAAWLYRHSMTNTPVDWASDGDGDGLNLLSEYAYGNDPNVADESNWLVQAQYNTGTGKLETTYTRRKDGTHDLGYTVALTTNLVDGAWSLPWAVQSTVDHPSLDPGLFEAQTIESDASLADEPALFLRVEITQP